MLLTNLFDLEKNDTDVVDESVQTLATDVTVYKLSGALL